MAEKGNGKMPEGMKGKHQEGKNLEQLVRLSLLYDFYGALLKEHKRSIFEDYVLNDYSLGEIAREENMTRQGVYDMVKRCSRELEQYEEKLLLVHKFGMIKKKAAIIRQYTESLLIKDMDGEAKAALKEIEGLTGEILEEL